MFHPPRDALRPEQGRRVKAHLQRLGVGGGELLRLAGYGPRVVTQVPAQAFPTVSTTPLLYELEGHAGALAGLHIKEESPMTVALCRLVLLINLPARQPHEVPAVGATTSAACSAPSQNRREGCARARTG